VKQNKKSVYSLQINAWLSDVPKYYNTIVLQHNKQKLHTIIQILVWTSW